MPMIRHAFHAATLALLVAGSSLSSAWAQESRDGLFGGLFGRSDRQQDRGAYRPPEATGAGPASEADLTVRLDRLENALDEEYWQWGDVQGLASTSTVLARYTSPPRSLVATVRWKL